MNDVMFYRLPFTSYMLEPVTRKEMDAAMAASPGASSTVALLRQDEEYNEIAPAGSIRYFRSLVNKTVRVKCGMKRPRYQTKRKVVWEQLHMFLSVIDEPPAEVTDTYCDWRPINVYESTPVIYGPVLFSCVNKEGDIVAFPKNIQRHALCCLFIACGDCMCGKDAY
jgi:hypothetical protein